MSYDVAVYRSVKFYEDGNSDITDSCFNFKIKRSVGSFISVCSLDIIYSITVNIHDAIRITDENGINIFKGFVTNIENKENVKTLTIEDVLVVARWREYTITTDPVSTNIKTLFGTLITAAYNQYGSGEGYNLSVTSDTTDSGTPSPSTVTWEFNHANIYERLQRIAMLTGWQYYYDPTNDKVYFKQRATGSATDYSVDTVGYTDNLANINWKNLGNEIVNNVNIVGGSAISTIYTPNSTGYAVHDGQFYPSTSPGFKPYPANLDSGSNGVYVYNSGSSSWVKKTLHTDYEIATGTPSDTYVIAFYPGYYPSGVAGDTFVRITSDSSSAYTANASDATSKSSYGQRDRTMYRTDITDPTNIDSVASNISSSSTGLLRNPYDEVEFDVPPGTTTILGGAANVRDGIKGITKDASENGMYISEITFNYPGAFSSLVATNKPVKDFFSATQTEDRVKRLEEDITRTQSEASSYATNPMTKDLDMGGYQIKSPIKIYLNLANTAWMIMNGNILEFHIPAVKLGIGSGLTAYAALNMNNYKITGLAAGTVAGDALRYEQVFPKQYVEVETFGAVGNGTTNDSVAFQNALDSLGITGGTVLIRADKKYLIDTSITVPAGCALRGQLELPGTLGDNNNTPYGNYGSAIILNSAATITLLSSATLINIILYRKGMTFPAPNSDSFAGTAVQIGGDDTYVSRCMFLGFHKAINSVGYQRPHVDYVFGDNNNGIHIENCWDVASIRECHFWPYATIETYKDGTGTGATAHSVITGGVVTSIVVDTGGSGYPGTPLPLVRLSGGAGSGATAHAVVSGGAVTSIVVDTGGSGYSTVPDIAVTYDPIIERSGTGIDFSDVADWSHITNCFVFGYLNDFHCINVNSTTFLGCGADQTAPRGDRNSAGFSIEGTCNETRLLGCQTGAQKYGIYINVTSFDVPTFVENCSIWSCNNGIYINNGDIEVMGGTIRDCPTGIVIFEDDAIINGVTIRGTSGYTFATNGVYIYGASSRVLIDNCVFKNIESSAIVNNAVTPNLWIGQNIFEEITYKPVAQDAGDPWTGAASASTMTLPKEGSFFSITGTTTINTIYGGWYGRVVVLRFADVLTLNNYGIGGLRLEEAYVTVAGSTLTLVARGYAEWYEISRSELKVVSRITTHAALTNVHGLPLFSTQTAYNQTQRAFGAVYQNNSGKVMFVTFSGESNTLWAYMIARSDSSNPPTVAVGYAQETVANSPVGFSFMVLPGKYYMIICTLGTPTLGGWIEWV